jgi:hypothetical protein
VFHVLDTRVAIATVLFVVFCKFVNANAALIVTDLRTQAADYRPCENVGFRPRLSTKSRFFSHSGNDWTVQSAISGLHKGATRRGAQSVDSSLPSVISVDGFRSTTRVCRLSGCIIGRRNETGGNLLQSEREFIAR